MNFCNPFDNFCSTTQISKYTLKRFINDLDLEVVYLDDDEKLISENHVYSIGPELIGFFCDSDGFLSNYIHLIGEEEILFLATLPLEKKRRVLTEYIQYDFPAIVLSSGVEPDPILLELAQKYNKPILKSHKDFTNTARNINYHLHKQLSPEIVLDAHILIEVFGIGVLLTGYQDAMLGSTIELIERDHKYIGDSNIIIKKNDSNHLIGINGHLRDDLNSDFFITNKDSTKLDIGGFFGIGSTRFKKQIDMIIRLEKWDEKKFYDRLGIDDKLIDIFGIKIPEVTLPVRKGRNLAVIIETAAMNQRLKYTGVNSAHYFLKKTEELIKNKKKQDKAGNDMKNKVTLSVRDFKKKFDLNIISGEELLDDTFIKQSAVHRPSLSLAGYHGILEKYGDNMLQIFSPVEFNFLSSLSESELQTNLNRYLKFNIPAIVITEIDITNIPEFFIKALKETKIVLLQTDRTCSEMTTKFENYLDTFFAHTITMHGVFVEMFGFGVLITGKSGIGKSETALELIHRGHRLVADDMVQFSRHSSGDVVGKAARLPHFMEIRGIGIIDIKTLYGLSSVRYTKRLDAVLELKEQKSEDYLSSAKFNDYSLEILGEPTYKAELFISSGRNAAAMVEIATMSMMAKKLGHDPQKAFEQKFTEMKDNKRSS